MRHSGSGVFVPDHLCPGNSCSSSELSLSSTCSEFSSDSSYKWPDRKLLGKRVRLLSGKSASQRTGRETCASWNLVVEAEGALGRKRPFAECLPTDHGDCHSSMLWAQKTQRGLAVHQRTAEQTDKVLGQDIGSKALVKGRFSSYSHAGNVFPGSCFITLFYFMCICLCVCM